ncbi:MAG: DEAD/DEAH box helicase [Rothia sp. (in: high G+C Gram-positive bacteria)]|uniref:DEAD/DEAH box helicase n=1 Tax=Rothia sp. (in: high G+C Gram-positive bacteria) TaxID=1885016 RepID=UPI0026DEE0D7|nr:DEAD/DEAH box helicase [Rothia sp. (in: high G+C Gram-positive bacteria)]MDO5750231.1 DEAD/DEAH box helicase [Rothia sp. (in: high G+C Gram-positive bacteria)]
MSAFPQIPITTAAIIRQVGNTVYTRGQRYAREGAVVRYSYDEKTRTLSGQVAGSLAVPYECTVRIGSGERPLSVNCDCPVRTVCKHAVALVVTAVEQAARARKALNIPDPNAPEPKATRAGQRNAPEIESLLANPKLAGLTTARKLEEDIQTYRDSAPVSAPAYGAASGADARGTAVEGTLDLEALPPLASSAPSAREQQSASRMSAWKRDLSHILAARPLASIHDGALVPAALDLSLNISTSRAMGRAMSGQKPVINLMARPVKRSHTGRWVKGGLSWENFALSGVSPVSRSGIYPEHDRFFTELYSLARPWQSAYSSHRYWISLSSTSSALLWELLERARSIDLPLLLDGREVSYAVMPPAQMRTLFSASGENSEDLSLHAALSWEARENQRVRQLIVPAHEAHPVGQPRTGFIALGAQAQKDYEQAASAALWNSVKAGAADQAHLVEFTLDAEPAAESKVASGTESVESAAQLSTQLPDIPAGVDLLFIPLTEPLDDIAASLVNTDSLVIPAAERPSFVREFLPSLVRSIPALTPDPALALPSVRPPQLVLSIDFDEQIAHDARLSWAWEYPADPTESDSASSMCVLPAVGYAGEETPVPRDSRYEAKVMRAVRLARAPFSFMDSGFEPSRYEGWETMEILSRLLPVLRRIPGVQVRLRGEVPSFREVDNTIIEIQVTDTSRRDWFGLGIALKVNDWHVPFSQVFEALDKQQDRMLLGNGTYFSLLRPEFAALRALMSEARALNDRSHELEINRHQSSLWNELEQLASSVQSVARWDEQVRSLSTLLDTHSENEPILPEASVGSALHASLRPYQQEGLNWLAFLYKHRLGGILADDMGLGKTVQAMALLSHALETHEALNEQRAAAGEEPMPFSPFLVVAPTSVVANWQAEAAAFLPDIQVAVLSESSSKSGYSVASRIAGAQLVITSYALLRLDEQEFIDPDIPGGSWGAFILDEAQFVKNATTRAWKVAREVPADFKLAMTGTPIENNLMELWALCALVADGLFPSARTFKELYVRAIEAARAEGEQQIPELERLKRRIRPLMLRRTKEQVVQELPAKNDERVVLDLAPTHRRIYDTHLQRERQKVLGLLEDIDKHRFTIFQSLALLRRLALDAALVDPERYEGVSSAKIDYLLQQLPALIHSGSKVLIFSQFTGFLKRIAAALQAHSLDYLYLDGSTRDRGAVLDQFRQGAAPIFLISLKAGGFGLNLTEADHCFIMDPWWNPAAEAQAVDRIHRIGQEREVHIYRLVARGTIEEKVMELKESKAQLFDALVGDESFGSTALGVADVRELFRPDTEDSL